MLAEAEEVNSITHALNVAHKDIEVMNVLRTKIKGKEMMQ